MKKILVIFVLLFGIQSAFAKDVAGFTAKHGCITHDAHSLTCKVVNGDTLSQDALNMYGNGYAYTTIQNANAKIVDANKIYAGDTIIVPIKIDPASTATATPSAPRDSRASSTGDAIAATATSGIDNQPTMQEAASPIEKVALATIPLVGTDVALVPAATLIASTPQPLTLPQSKGWYKITVAGKNFPKVSNAMMYHAVFVDNSTNAGTWRYRKDVNAIVEKNDDGTVAILVCVPKEIEASSILAVGNILLEGSDIARKGQRIPAPNLKHLATEKNPDAAAQEHALRAGFIKQHSTGKCGRVMGYGLLAAQNVAAVFIPSLWIPAGIADARFITGKMEQHFLADEERALAALQKANASPTAAPEQQ